MKWMEVHDGFSNVRNVLCHRYVSTRFGKNPEPQKCFVVFREVGGGIIPAGAITWKWESIRVA